MDSDDKKITQLTAGVPVGTDIMPYVSSPSSSPVTKKTLVSSLFSSIIPGGRLTLTSGTPVTISDVASSTNIYYTPYTSNEIMLWDGSAWQRLTFSEITLALGTMTASRGYDVFAYISSGAVALETLVWTSATARATGISIQDGRYCKTGDKTRLYLGSFYSTSTTQTADSESKRFLWNMYNRTWRSLKVESNAPHNYNVATIRAFNDDQANSDVEYFVGLVEDVIPLSVFAQILRAATDGAPRVRFGVNSTTAEYGIYGLALATLVGRLTGGGTAPVTPSLGYSYACITEFSSVGTAPGTSFESAALTGTIRA